MDVTYTYLSLHMAPECFRPTTAVDGFTGGVGDVDVNRKTVEIASSFVRGGAGPGVTNGVP